MNHISGMQSTLGATAHVLILLRCKCIQTFRWRFACCRTYHDQAMVMIPRRPPHILICKQGLPAAMTHLGRLVGSLPTPAVTSAASSAAGSVAPAAALPAAPLTARPGVQAAITAALPLNGSPASISAVMTPSQEPSQGAVTQQLPASAATAAANSPLNSKESDSVSHGPAQLTIIPAGCQSNVSAAPEQAVQAETAVDPAFTRSFNECCGLAEMVFQKWPAGMHLKSPVLGTTFSKLLCQLGMEGLALKVLDELKVRSHHIHHTQTCSTSQCQNRHADMMLLL